MVPWVSVLMLAPACRSDDEVSTRPQRAPTIVLVSLDTARADAFDCYAEQSHWGVDLGASDPPLPDTPRVCGLAEEGLRYGWALAQSPTTLSSHATMFTGLDPHAHGVPRNGYPLDPSVPVFTERFAQAGWATRAVVGSSPLDPEMGLARGFEVYDAPGTAAVDEGLWRGGAEVSRLALAQVDGVDPEQPLLLFVHYFDPHMPWLAAPEELASRFRPQGYTGWFDGSPQALERLTTEHIQGGAAVEDLVAARGRYLAEVAWADQQLGVLLDGLEARGRLADALVMVLSDHGEVLDEMVRPRDPGVPTLPFGHGNDVDLVGIHVPLVVWGSGRFAVQQPGVVHEPVGLWAVGPSLLTLAGLDGRLGGGRLLHGLVPGATPSSEPLLSEATKPIGFESTTAWNNLPFERAAVTSEGLLIRAPQFDREVLYGLAPGQPVLDSPATVTRLGAALDEWDAAAPPWRPLGIDDQTRAALEALGYLSAESPPSEP